MIPENQFDQPAQLKPWQLALNRFFNRAFFEVLIGVLVLLSVGLTLFEFWLESELAFRGPTVVTKFAFLGG